MIPSHHGRLRSAPLSILDPTAWPEPSAGGALGDGLSAHATERSDSVDALREIVKNHVAQGLAIYPQGGRTALDYGGIPARPGIAVDITALNQVVDYPWADMTITIEAGMTLARPPNHPGHPEPAVRSRRAPSRARDPRRDLRDQHHSVTQARRRPASRPNHRRQLRHLEWRPGQGRRSRRQERGGVRLPKLITGSMGTLGIITQMTLKVRPASEASAIAWCGFDSDPISRPPGRPQHVSNPADRNRPAQLPAAQTIGGPLGLPTDRSVLAIGFEDNAQSVPWQLDALKKELPRAHFSVVETKTVNGLWEALSGFQAVEAGLLGFQANLRRSSVASFVAELDPWRWSVQAHAASGIVRAHALGDWGLAAIQRALEPLRRRVVAEGGNLTLPKCPTAWKTTLGVWGQPQADWPLGENVRAALDPHQALNPGRFIGTIK